MVMSLNRLLMNLKSRHRARGQFSICFLHANHGPKQHVLIWGITDPCTKQLQRPAFFKGTGAFTKIDPALLEYEPHRG